VDRMIIFKLSINKLKIIIIDEKYKQLIFQLEYSYQS